MIMADRIDLEAMFGRDALAAARATMDQRMAAATEVVRIAYVAESTTPDSRERVLSALALSNKVVELLTAGTPADELALAIAKCAGELGVQMVAARKQLKAAQTELADLKAGKA